MKISDAAIKKPVFAWMLMLALLVLGGLGGMRLGVSRMPDIDFPQVTVSLRFDGAGPEVMETDVVDVVEDVCMSIEGVKEITSSSRQDQASVTIEFEIGRDIDMALQDVQTKIAQAQTRLPRGIEPPTVTKQNPEDQPIMWVGLSGPRPPQVLSDLARYKVRERLQTVPGVGEIMLGGYRERNVRIWIDEERLEARQLTVTDVLDALRREHLEMPAGRLESTSREVNVRTEGEALDIEQFRSIVISERGGAQTLLRDVAIVEDGLEDRRRIARSMGMPAQGMGVKKQRGANAVAVAQGIKAMVEKIRKELPPDVSLDVVFDGTSAVEEAIHEIFFTLILAVVLTSLVVWLFLGSISSTINVLLSIPTSIVGTFAAMYFLGFTFNTFSLLALSLAVGIVVDDAIMVLENIFRRAEGGEGRVRASVSGARQIAFAAMAATAAIVAIFLPVAFMKGIIGKFFFQFGVTISVCVLLSLLEALTL
ncbi:MAG: efflux RND transporter permease subunit, partial [Planctomycetota bacterium]